MREHKHLFGIILLGTVASICLACGDNRRALSVTVSPAIVTAPVDGQVQFTATGTFSAAPTPVTPLQATWAVVDQSGLPTTAVTVSANGLAQCGSGTSGSFTVGAWVLEFSHPPNAVCLTVTAFGNPCDDSVIGFAQLTCP
jgi:hypothetical protein